MSSRFEPVTDVDLALEYRKAGLLYYKRPWMTKTVWELCDNSYSACAHHRTRWDNPENKYAVLIEE